MLLKCSSILSSMIFKMLLLLIILIIIFSLKTVILVDSALYHFCPISFDSWEIFNFQLLHLKAHDFCIILTVLSSVLSYVVVPKRQKGSNHLCPISFDSWEVSQFGCNFVLFFSSVLLNPHIVAGHRRLVSVHNA